MESAAARICREARGRVTTNVMVRDLDLAAPKRQRCASVGGGCGPLAMNTTWCRRSTVMAVRSGVHPTVMGLHRALAARLVVLAGEVDGRWSHETQTFLRLLAKARARESALMKCRVEWSIFCCAEAKAFVASLLELRPAWGSDGGSSVS